MNQGSSWAKMAVSGLNCSFSSFYIKYTLEENNWRKTREFHILQTQKFKNIVSMGKFSIMILEFYQTLLGKFKIRSEN